MNHRPRRRSRQRQKVPLRMQRRLGPTSIRILEAVAAAWPRLTVSSLADELEQVGWSRNTTHKIRQTLEARKLLEQREGEALELTDHGRRWLKAWPECPITAQERPTGRKILRALEARGGEAQTVDLGEDLGLTRQTIGRWLRMMRDDGAPLVQELAGPLTVWRLEGDP